MTGPVGIAEVWLTLERTVEVVVVVVGVRVVVVVDVVAAVHLMNLPLASLHGPAPGGFAGGGVGVVAAAAAGGHLVNFP